ncbi:MAG: LUD domain-containing protein [Gammaproteobacteria bacterium]|nr:LUD domain-containing protein [Gammaproteobacteria bacterium]
MNKARDDIFDSIRASLRRTGPLDSSVAAALEQRITARPSHPRPQVAENLVETFARKVQEVGGTIAKVSGLGEVPGAVRQHLVAHSLPSQLVASRDPVLEHIDWPEALTLDVRAALGTDVVAVTGALAAVAETGTLIMVSGRDTPTTLRLLPDDHIVVITADQIVTHLEDGWAEVRRNFEKMPRTVNMITGPSKTADVEQTLQIGAHGPRRLHVILVLQRD